MRKLALILMLAAMARPGLAVRQMTVEQVEQLLAKLDGKADAKVADELADVEMTQRVSSARLARWEKQFTGAKTREVLMKLADTAAFLKAPGSDAVPDPAPDTETQQRMLWLAVQYVRTTITQLPNFYATRETVHFESDPEQRTDTGLLLNRLRGTGAGGSARAMHNRGMTSSTVTFREGHEVQREDAAQGGTENQKAAGLTTTGEFGPILGVVIGDAASGTPEWERWEQGESDPVAVYHYEVPEGLSHFTLKIPNGKNVDDYHPEYHGEIAIDPATGAIIRLSVITLMPPPFDRMAGAIAVEYATVTIGDRSYICPVKGVALSKVPAAGAITAPQRWEGPLVTELNDVAFTHYHVFRTEARMISDGGEAGETAPANGAAPAGRPQQ